MKLRSRRRIYITTSLNPAKPPLYLVMETKNKAYLSRREYRGLPNQMFIDLNKL